MTTTMTSQPTRMICNKLDYRLHWTQSSKALGWNRLSNNLWFRFSPVSFGVLKVQKEIEGNVLRASSLAILVCIRLLLFNAIGVMRVINADL